MTDQRDGGIAWTDETWNVIRGCSDVNEDCRNCYAKQLAATRLSGPGQPYDGLAKMKNGKAVWTGKVQLVEDLVLQPLRWKRPRKIFVNAMSDLFHDGLSRDQIDQVIAVMALAHWHTFQVLTKRPERMAEHFSEGDARDNLAGWIDMTLEQCKEAGLVNVHHRRTDDLIATAPDVQEPFGWPLPNVWWGVSMGHQKAVDEFMPHVLECRPHAAVLWISAEPLIERIQFPPGSLRLIDWIVAGGESTKNARPMHPAWPKAVQREAELAGVPFHFKQWGEWLPVTYLEPNRQMPMLNISCGTKGKKERIVSSGANDHKDDINMVRVGKKAAGRLLDGRAWDQWPIKALQVERIN